MNTKLYLTAAATLLAALYTGTAYATDFSTAAGYLDGQLYALMLIAAVAAFAGILWIFT